MTPTVFCAVSAVIAVIPCTPQRANAFRSAWMPAPPPESEPAIESTAGTGRGIWFRLGARGTRSLEPLDRLRAPVGGLVVVDPEHALAVLLEQCLAPGDLVARVVVVRRAVRFDDEPLPRPAEVGADDRVADAERDVDVGLRETGFGDQLDDEIFEDAARRRARLADGGAIRPSVCGPGGARG